tara:strand:+ start:84 stop:275 length:192 start_codon:yes stop_codon:yes gene_type:complete
MTLVQKIAKFVAPTLDKATSDRYEQIWAIKAALIAHDRELWATDRETIDAVLDIMFDEYGFKG